LCPQTWFRESDIQFPCIIRPQHHARGNRFYVCPTPDFYRGSIRATFIGGGYASEIIEKTEEYRVHICSGRIVSVAKKMPPENPYIAWNHHQGASFVNVRWGEWNRSVIEKAMDAMHLSGLDFGGVDVIVGPDGPYVIEINSAPTIESPYRIHTLARAFDWIIENGKEHIESGRLDLGNRGGWFKEYVHPAVYFHSRSDDNE